MNSERQMAYNRAWNASTAELWFGRSSFLGIFGSLFIIGNGNQALGLAVMIGSGAIGLGSYMRSINNTGRARKLREYDPETPFFRSQWHRRTYAVANRLGLLF